MATATLPTPETHTDTFPINGTDYIEFWVGNAKQSSIYYRTVFGFNLVGYRGPETGVRDRASYLLTQDKLRFVLTSPMGPEGAIAEHIHLHGDGVRDMAFWVDDARAAHKVAVERGATSRISLASSRMGSLAPTMSGNNVVIDSARSVEAVHADIIAHAQAKLGD